MKKLPENTRPYKRTPIFNENTVPKGLLRNHNTKNGVWGLLTVEKGEIEYTIETMGSTMGSNLDFKPLLFALLKIWCNFCNKA